MMPKTHNERNEGRRRPSALLLIALAPHFMAALSSTILHRGFLVPLEIDCPGGCRNGLLGGMQRVATPSFGTYSTHRRCRQLQISARGGGAFRPSNRPKPTRIVKGRPQMEGNGDDTPAMNEEIRAREVRLMAEDKSLLGVCSRDEALEKARAAELDLVGQVMIAPDASPPVVRIMDYSKYRFEQQKKKREQQKKAAASRSELKELKMRYNIETHDYDVRLRSARKFLASGDRVKVTVQFRGREMEFKDIAFKLFTKFQADIGEIGSLDSKPKMDGKILQMVIAPNKVTAQKERAAERKAQTLQNKSAELSSADEGDEGEKEKDEEEDGDEQSSILDNLEEDGDNEVGNGIENTSKVEQLHEVDTR